MKLYKSSKAKQLNRKMILFDWKNYLKQSKCGWLVIEKKAWKPLKFCVKKMSQKIFTKRRFDWILILRLFVFLFSVKSSEKLTVPTLES